MALLQCFKPRPALKPQYLDITLQGWPITHVVIEALQGLTECGRLEFEQCTWPLAPTEYKAMGECLPVTVTDCIIRGELSAGVLHAICEGVQARRAGCGRGLRSLNLRVYDASITRSEWSQAGVTYQGVEVFIPRR